MKAVKKPPVFDVFHVKPEMFLHYGDLRKWVESFGDNFDNKFDAHPNSSGKEFYIQLKLLHASSDTTHYISINADSVILRDGIGNYYVLPPHLFEKFYTVIP